MHVFFYWIANEFHYWVSVVFLGSKYWCMCVCALYHLKWKVCLMEALVLFHQLAVAQFCSMKGTLV